MNYGLNATVYKEDKVVRKFQHPKKGFSYLSELEQKSGLVGYTVQFTFHETVVLSAKDYLDWYSKVYGVV